MSKKTGTLQTPLAHAPSDIFAQTRERARSELEIAVQFWAATMFVEVAAGPNGPTATRFTFSNPILNACLPWPHGEPPPPVMLGLRQSALEKSPHLKLRYLVHHALMGFALQLASPAHLKKDGTLSANEQDQILRRFHDYLADKPELLYDVGVIFQKLSPQFRPLDQRTLEAEIILDAVTSEPSVSRVGVEDSIKNNLTRVFQRARQRNRPKKPPQLWDDRDKELGETSLVFLRRVYDEWLNDITISEIGQLDHPLYIALKKWAERHTVPRDLIRFFGDRRTRRSSEEVEAELNKHKIKEPADAFKRFPNDPATARRLYNAARKRL